MVMDSAGLSAQVRGVSLGVGVGGEERRASRPAKAPGSLGETLMPLRQASCALLTVLMSFSAKSQTGASRNRQTPASSQRIKGAPESNKRPKGKGHEATVFGRDPNAVQDRLPGLDPPLPVFCRVEHDQRSAAGTRRLMETDVAREFKGSMRRVIAVGLRGNQLLFERIGPVDQLSKRLDRTF